MHSAEELAELAGVDVEVVEDAKEAADRLIPTNRLERTDEFNPVDREIPSIDSTCYEVSEE